MRPSYNVLMLLFVPYTRICFCFCCFSGNVTNILAVLQPSSTCQWGRLLTVCCQRFTHQPIVFSFGLAMRSVSLFSSRAVACSRLRDGGGKSFSNKKSKKRAGAGERQGVFPAATAPFPKSRASFFCFARFNTFPLYYLRAWHRLMIGKNADTKALSIP